MRISVCLQGLSFLLSVCAQHFCAFDASPGAMKPLQRTVVSLGVRKAKTTFPTGDSKFSVLQAFPAGFTAEEASPFLMLDHFGPTLATVRETDPDSFPVPWHPHRGMDICTYMTKGRGRHADSMGCRGEFPSPGIQWISVGSGIEHAEAGGTPVGEMMEGFQIWVNTPPERKMDEPAYGTEGPDDLPVLDLAVGVTARLLAGSIPGHAAVGPFKTAVSVQMIDLDLAGGAVFTHTLPPLSLTDNALLYVHAGEGVVAGEAITRGSVIRLDASDADVRSFVVSAGAAGMKGLLFSGRMIHAPIAWHGPFVMNTDVQIRQTLDEYRRGEFLKKRAPWDYKRIGAAPQGWDFDTGTPGK